MIYDMRHISAYLDFKKVCTLSVSEGTTAWDVIEEGGCTDQGVVDVSQEYIRA